MNNKIPTFPLWITWAPSLNVVGFPQRLPILFNPVSSNFPLSVLVTFFSKPSFILSSSCLCSLYIVAERERLHYCSNGWW